MQKTYYRCKVKKEYHKKLRRDPYPQFRYGIWHLEKEQYETGFIYVHKATQAFFFEEEVEVIEEVTKEVL